MSVSISIFLLSCDSNFSDQQIVCYSDTGPSFVKEIRDIIRNIKNPKSKKEDLLDAVDSVKNVNKISEKSSKQKRVKNLGNSFARVKVVKKEQEIMEYLYLDNFIELLKSILDLKFQSELSEYMGFGKTYLANIKKNVKMKKIKGISSDNLRKAFFYMKKKILRKRSINNDKKILRIKKLINFYKELVEYPKDASYLTHFNLLITKLIIVLEINHNNELSDYMGLYSNSKLSYISELKGLIERGERKGITIDSLLRGRAHIRANLILNSKIEKLDNIDIIIYNYIDKVKDIEELGYKGESPLYLPLKRL